MYVAMKTKTPSVERKLNLIYRLFDQKSHYKTILCLLYKKNVIKF